MTRLCWRIFLELCTARLFGQNKPILSLDVRLIFAYRNLVSQQPNEAPGKIIYLGACLVGAVRLAREEDWRNSPRVVSRISDAISLAKRIYDRMKDGFART